MGLSPAPVREITPLARGSYAPDRVFTAAYVWASGSNSYLFRGRRKNGGEKKAPKGHPFPDISQFRAVLFELSKTIREVMYVDVVLFKGRDWMSQFQLGFVIVSVAEYMPKLHRHVYYDFN